MKNAQLLLLKVFFLSIIATAVKAQVVLTEIMHNPSLGHLPNHPYIEIYNAGLNSVSLKGYHLQIANTRIPLLDRSLAPKQYMLLVEPSAESSFQAYGNVMALLVWRSPSRTNGTIRLLDSLGKVVDEVLYRSSWYKSIPKRTGGWSLERKSPNFRCNSAESWAESQALTGGTPGERNSVWDDAFQPALGLTSTLLAPDRVQLDFKQSLMYSGPINSANFIISPEKYKLQAIERQGQRLHIQLSQPLDKDTEVKLSLSDFLCCGIAYQAELTLFNASALLAQDLIINEVLFNPKTKGGEFVEIYNRSGRIVNLQGCFLGNQLIAEEALLFEPDGFRLLASSAAQVKKDYPLAVVEHIIELPKRPNLGNEVGDVLLKMEAIMLDSLRYSSSMHQPFLHTVKGISLERRGYNVETNAAGSFSSAAILAGGATPGYENSSYVEKNTGQNKVFLHSKSLSPDGDGFEDFLVIGYSLVIDNPMLSITIYDERGSVVNRLIRNQSAGSQGEVRWDGRDQLGRVCPAGFYLCFAELYTSTGHFQSFKESFVLVKQQPNY